MASVEAEIKSKCGVCPLITHPKAKKPSYFFKFLKFVTGISKAPGTLIIFILFFGIIFKCYLLSHQLYLYNNLLQQLDIKISSN